MDRATLIAESTLVRSGVGSSLNIRWAQGEPVTFTSQQPSDDVLKSLLVDLRPTIQDGEAVNITDILGICDRRLTNDSMRTWLRDVRAAWLQSLRTGLMQLQIDDQDMPPWKVADLVISTRFHSSIAKKRELDAIVGEARLLTDHVFIDYVFRAIDAVLSSASAIRLGLETDQFDWR